MAQRYRVVFERDDTKQNSFDSIVLHATFESDMPENEMTEELKQLTMKFDGIREEAGS
jgi:hypothetical protein